MSLHHPIREQPPTNAKTDTLQSTLYSQAVPPRPVFHSSNASKPASPSAQGLDAAQSTSQSRGRWLKDIILPKIGRWTRSSRDRIAGDIASTSPIASSSAWIHPHSRSEVSLRIVEQHSPPPSEPGNSRRPSAKMSQISTTSRTPPTQSPRITPSPALQPVPPTPPHPSQHALFVQSLPPPPRAPALLPARTTAQPLLTRVSSLSGTSACTSLRLPEPVTQPVCHRPPLVSRFSDTTTSASDIGGQLSSDSRRESMSNSLQDDVECPGTKADVRDDESIASIASTRALPRQVQRLRQAPMRPYIYRTSPLYAPAPPIIEASTQTPPISTEMLCGFPAQSSSASTSAFDPLRWTTSDFHRHHQREQLARELSFFQSRAGEPSSFAFGKSMHPTSVASSTGPSWGNMQSSQPGVMAWSSNVANASADQQHFADNGDFQHGNEPADESFDEESWNKSSAFAERKMPSKHARRRARRQSC